MRSDLMHETLLPKKLALPVFCSDPLSSNAYATEEILLMLSVGGLTLLYLTPWIAAAVVVLLVVVVASYRQTCHAYPNGGGAYAVSRANLGRNASLVAASALLVDYVLTVAVSVAAGVANIVSAVPELAPQAVGLALGLVVLLAVMNLRGVRESGRVFAVPTYGFVACVFVMLGAGLVDLLLGDTPQAESAAFTVTPQHQVSGLLVVAVALRAFASGCTALTGVEAVSNGVPNFKPPKSRNAATTLAVMGGLTVAMFVGITAFALITGVHVAADPAQLVGAPSGYEQRTVIAQVAGGHLRLPLAGFFRDPGVHRRDPGSGREHRLQRVPDSGFDPRRGRIPAPTVLSPRRPARVQQRHRHPGAVRGAAHLGLRRQHHPTDPAVHHRGVRLLHPEPGRDGRCTGRVFSPTAQSRARSGAATMKRARAINAVGAVVTTVVLVIVLITKFTHGAWIVVLAMPAVFWVMTAIRRHYDRVDAELRPGPAGVTLPSHIHAVVLVSKLHTPTLRALAFARATRPDHPRGLDRAQQPHGDRRAGASSGSSGTFRCRW